MTTRITVDQAAIRRGDPNPIHIHYVDCDTRVNVAAAVLHGPSEIRYASAGNELADGSRVWIETHASVEGIVK